MLRFMPVGSLPYLAASNDIDALCQVTISLPLLIIDMLDDNRGTQPR